MYLDGLKNQGADLVSHYLTEEIILKFYENKLFKTKTKMSIVEVVVMQITG